VFECTIEVIVAKASKNAGVMKMTIKMTTRLVELTPDGCSLEIDQVRLLRAALNFKNWLLQIDPLDDPYDIIGKNMPLVSGVLDGTLPLPYTGNRPLFNEWWDGLIREDYGSASVTFYYLIAGLNLARERDKNGLLAGRKKVDCLNGKSYGWAEFEMPTSYDEITHSLIA
jgi:hypothetical protein